MRLELIVLINGKYFRKVLKQSSIYTIINVSKSTS